LLHNDSAELGAEQRARRAHVQTLRVRAVLAHIGAHQPPEVGSGLGAGGVAWAALELRDAHFDGRRAQLAATACGLFDR
jgi:hypothetical protein